MRVRIVSYESLNSWILGKFARKLQEHLSQQGVSVDIGDPDPSADINHHIIYIGYDTRLPSGNDSLMITHIDDLHKLKLLKEQMDKAVLGVCMSRDTMVQLANAGIPKSKLCFINPAHDSDMLPRKWKVGITSRVYPDGCKREDFLAKLSGVISPELFEFHIMGAGWEQVIATMTRRGLSVKYEPDFDQRGYRSLMSNIDYFLYLGMDEGSMGFIDALAAGVKTIVTSQGFHLDVQKGIDYPFTTFDELVSTFGKLESELKGRIHNVSGLTWENYSVKHKQVWEHLLTGHIPDGSTWKQNADGLTSLLSTETTGSVSRRMSSIELATSSLRKRWRGLMRIKSLDELIRKIVRKFARK